MSQEKRNLYEGMYIISSKLSDEARKKALEKITEGISQRGGEVLKMHDQGRKRLAYEIAGHKEGHYYVLYFEVAPKAISEMWQEYHLHEDLVRFITMRTDEVKQTLTFKTIEEEE